jgi:sialate O-acetylesterase
VWGESAPGDRVSVSIEGSKAEARADAAGHWHAVLPAMPAGGPYALSVHTQSGTSRSISDILIGDVFLCSGQSNMELPVANTLNHANEIAHSANDRIRLLTVAHATSPKPLAHFETPVAWAAASPESIANFSAACYYFARELQKSVFPAVRRVRRRLPFRRCRALGQRGVARRGSARDARAFLLG